MIPGDGSLRLEQLDEEFDPVDGMNTVQTQYGTIHGLPGEIEPGDVLIVSTLVGDKWPPIDRPPGVTVIVPDTGPSCHRDEGGRVLAVRRSIRK